MQEKNLEIIAKEIKEAGFNCYADNTRNAIVFIEENSIAVKQYLDKHYGKDIMVTNVELTGKGKLLKSIPFKYIMIGGVA